MLLTFVPYLTIKSAQTTKLAPLFLDPLAAKAAESDISKGAAQKRAEPTPLYVHATSTLLHLHQPGAHWRRAGYAKDT